MIKKKYLSIAVALALSSTYAQAQEINTEQQQDAFNGESLTVVTGGKLTANSVDVSNNVVAQGQGKIIVHGNMNATSVATEKDPNNGRLVGNITVDEKLTLTGSGNSLTNALNGKISVGELSVSNSSLLIKNEGTINIGSLTGEASSIYNNTSGSVITITTMPVALQKLTNLGTFKVGSKGDILNVNGNVVNTTGTITAVDGSNIGLKTGGGFSTDSEMTLTSLEVGTGLTVNANLTVLGNTTVKQAISVGAGKLLTVNGNLDASTTPPSSTHSLAAVNGSIKVLGNAHIYDGEVGQTGGLSVGGVLTLGKYLDFKATSDKFDVKNLVIDHDRKTGDSVENNVARLSLFGQGDYHFDSVVLKNSSGLEESFNGIQMFHGNLTVGTMDVGENTNGAISFVTDTNHTADIGQLNVQKNGIFLVGASVGSHADGTVNNVVVGNAVFADGTRINKGDGNIGLTITELTAQGDLNIGTPKEGVEPTTDYIALNIGKLHANGGAVTIDQPMQGASSIVNIAEGASVAMNKGTTVDSLTVNMSTLAKDALVVDSVGENTKTNINVDGKLNNKDATAVVQELDSAVQLGKDDKGNYEFVIGEGDIFGEIKGNNSGYYQEENSKLGGIEAVTALSALTLRHEMNSLSKRMGELRDTPAGVGAWARAYGSEMEYGKQNVTAKNTSIQVGSDYTIGDWKVGAAFTFTDGESSYDKGTADNKGYGIALYGTWFVPCGAYVDLIAKYNRLDTDFGFGNMKGSYKNDAFGLSAETGYRFKFLNEGAFVEPQLGLSYGYMTGDKFLASNGVTIDQDDYNSLIGRLGVRTGFKFPKDKGMIYARVSGVYDFQGSMDATATKGDQHGTMSEDLGGAWLEMGLGANFNWSDRTYTYIDLERTNGGHVKENYRWNIGVRHTF